MLHTVTPCAMRTLEQEFMKETGYPSLLLMEHAAQAVAQALLRHVPQGARVLFACGSAYRSFRQSEAYRLGTPLRWWTRFSAPGFRGTSRAFAPK